MTGHALGIVPAMMAMYLPFCATDVRPTLQPNVPAVSLWEEPWDLSERDLFYGPWGEEHAPDPDAVYTFVKLKRSGINPGMTVRDPRGREWSVKQAPANDWPEEGPVEVVLSRVLSAVGYHQPPVHYLPAFTLENDWGRHTEPGGRFRLKVRGLKEVHTWSWQQNPFVGTRPYQGLLVILMIFNGCDLKNSNNSLYEYRAGDLIERWYVVRDLGAALGSSGRFAPRKNDVVTFERQPFIKSVNDGIVQFHYGGWHQELVRGRITVNDLEWATDLLAGLSHEQWEAAFRAGGYSAPIAQRFIAAIERRIAEGQRLAGRRANDANADER